MVSSKQSMKKRHIKTMLKFINLLIQNTSKSLKSSNVHFHKALPCDLKTIHLNASCGSHTFNIDDENIMICGKDHTLFGKYYILLAENKIKKIS